VAIKEVIVENCCRCPFFHHDPSGETPAENYCLLDNQIMLDDYYCKSPDPLVYGFPETCPLFENDQVVVKRVRLRYLNSDSAKWEVKDDIVCADCGKTARGYRLVYAKDYDRLNQNQPEFRCEKCSIRKAQELKQRGVEL